MVKQTIQIFSRIRPLGPKQKPGQYELSDGSEATISFFVPKDGNDGYINNKKDVYKFRFNKIFDMKTNQDEIFDNVAKPVIDNVLAGYNGTIFAYGQTGSGKTFTISGGLDRYIDRGIVPRSLSYVFNYLAKAPGSQYTVHISYLEIYNEDCFDLLHDLKDDTFKLEDLPKVTMLEDSEQNIHLKNLSTHQVTSEEEALNLLFLGDTNRVIAETPMNQASTRSHCIFTVQITSREEGSATIRRSKLHLVDLAGSERVGKTGVNGVILTEAKYINLSLHHLEQVIVALSEKNRQHVPYRNSMMTKVLRDSLGGNSLTTMIATLSVEKRNTDESISTCRFAQRVALVKNDAILNEELDPKLLIVKLRQRISELEEEVMMLRGDDPSSTGDLKSEEILKCEQLVNYYLDDTDQEASLNVGADMRKIRKCYKFLKDAVLEARNGERKSDSSITQQAGQLPEAPTAYDNAEEHKLKGLIVQRDNEITILVNMLKKIKKELEHSKGNTSHGIPSPSSTDQNSSTRKKEIAHTQNDNRTDVAGDRGISSSESSTFIHDRSRQIVQQMSHGRQEAYDLFIRDSRQSQVIEEHKRQLKAKYVQAKELGDDIKQAQSKIANLKASMEKHRYSKVARGQVNLQNPEVDEMENEIRQQLEVEKHHFKTNLDDLRQLKTETEHLKYLLQSAKLKMTKDFEMWWVEQTIAMQEKQGDPGIGRHGPRNAWRTPENTPGSSRDSSATNVHLNGSPRRLQNLQSPGLVSNKNPIPTQPYRPSNAMLANPLGPRPPSASQQKDFKIQLTGDKDVDADILAFWEQRRGSNRT